MKPNIFNNVDDVFDFFLDIWRKTYLIKKVQLLAEKYTEPSLLVSNFILEYV